MDYIIGRKPGESLCKELRIISKTSKKEYILKISTNVPQSVSREHCLLSVDPKQGTTILINLQSYNTTWVEGVEIASKRVMPDDDIALGASHFPLNLQEVLEIVARECPKSYSIAYLEGVWKKYQQDKMNLQIKERRNGAMRSVTGVLSPLAILCAFVPIPGVSSVLRFALFGSMFIIALYFLISGLRNAAKYPNLYAELDKQFHRDYVCPNPSCQRFLGCVPYEDLIKTTFSCPSPKCKAEYTT